MSMLDKDLEQLQAGSNYKFSATKIDKLGASEYTLATIVQDASGSVESWGPQLEQAIKTIVKACEKSPRRDNLMLRLTQFNDRLTELHGFKLFGSIKESDYDGILSLGGSTALFDALDESIQATATYAKQLKLQQFLCNAIVVVVTDGQNNSGNIMDPADIKKSLDAARKNEDMESILLILVGVTGNDTTLDVYLQDVKDKAGVTQYVSIGKATPQKLAKLAEFVSQSISSTSSALGTGAASQPIQSFTF